MRERTSPHRALLEEWAEWVRIPKEDRRAWQCEPYQRSACRDTIARMQDAVPMGAYGPSGTPDHLPPSVPRRVLRHEAAIKSFPWPHQDVLLAAYVERANRDPLGRLLARAEERFAGWLDGWVSGRRY